MYPKLLKMNPLKIPEIEIPGLTTTKRKRRKLKKPRVLKVVRRQTGERASLKLDRKRKALPPGKRISRTGRVYWETRRNRSDLRRGI
jgi:hypothetical protein